MNCRKASRWISLELDGELDGSRLARLEEHLGQCPRCRATRAAWSSCSTLLAPRASKGTVSTESDWRAIQPRLTPGTRAGRADASPFHPLAWSPVSAAAAAVFLVAVLAGLVWWGMSPGPRVDEEIRFSSMATEVEWIETDVPGALSMVYRDAETGLTVIWVDMPRQEDENGADS
jgi:predicted anti-sigma-YlaC factor YlaD